MAKLPNYKDCPSNVHLMHHNLLFNSGFVPYHYSTHHSRITFKGDLRGFNEKFGKQEQGSRNRG